MPALGLHQMLAKQLARARIECDHIISTGTYIYRIADFDRRHFERGLGIAGVKGPRQSQLRDIAAVDLRERTEARTAGIIAVVRPVISRWRRCWGWSRGTAERGEIRDRDRQLVTVSKVICSESFDLWNFSFDFHTHIASIFGDSRSGYCIGSSLGIPRY